MKNVVLALTGQGHCSAGSADPGWNTDEGGAEAAHPEYKNETVHEESPGLVSLTILRGSNLVSEAEPRSDMLSALPPSLFADERRSSSVEERIPTCAHRAFVVSSSP